jgi:hypothetical protein
MLLSGSKTRTIELQLKVIGSKKKKNDVLQSRNGKRRKKRGGMQNGKRLKKRGNNSDFSVNERRPRRPSKKQEIGRKLLRERKPISEGRLKMQRRRQVKTV